MIRPSENSQRRSRPWLSVTASLALAASLSIAGLACKEHPRQAKAPQGVEGKEAEVAKAPAAAPGSEAPSAAAPAAPKQDYGSGEQGGDERAQAAVADPLEVTVGGKPYAEWTMATLSKVDPSKNEGKGEKKKDSWSLRDLAKGLIGPNARIVAVASEGGDRLAIDNGRWKDPNRTPMLRVNRRGEFKFEWSPPGQSTEAQRELRSVRYLEVEL